MPRQSSGLVFQPLLTFFRPRKGSGKLPIERK